MHISMTPIVEFNAANLFEFEGNKIELKIPTLRSDNLESKLWCTRFSHKTIVGRILCTPSPWLTRIHFTRISLTRIFKKFQFLT